LTGAKVNICFGITMRETKIKIPSLSQPFAGQFLN
jgi:hypothetical protein